MNNSIDFKLKLLEIVDAAIVELDHLPNREDKTALVAYVGSFWLEHLPALTAYAAMRDDTRDEVRKGFAKRSADLKRILREGA